MSVQAVPQVSGFKGPPIDDVALDIGKRLRSIRVRKDISQEVLAKKIGVTFQQIQKYERGLNRIHFGRLMSICKVLGVNWEYFLDPLDAADLFTRDVFQSRTAVEMLDAFNRVTDSGARRSLITMAEKLADKD